MPKCQCSDECDDVIEAGRPFLNLHSYDPAAKLSTRKVLIHHVSRANPTYDVRPEFDGEEARRQSIVDAYEERTARLAAEASDLAEKLRQIEGLVNELRTELVKVAAERDAARIELNRLAGATHS